MKPSIVWLIVCSLWAMSVNALPVFPGAEGFGTDTVAGRGGQVCKVTNLNDSGAGSLRQCVEMSGPRIVVFETGGTITLQSSLRIQNPFISIYGQTAPGDGIMITGSPDFESQIVIVATHDVLIQYLRIRAGNSTVAGGSCCRDALSLHNGTPGQVYNVVIDHNSLSWGTDEIMDSWYDANTITISNNIIGQSLHNITNGGNDPAGRGALFGADGAHSVSFHHNYLVHSYARNPNFSAYSTTPTTPMDMVNNVVYNWVSGVTEVQPRNNNMQYVNVVGNLYKMGQESFSNRVEIYVSDPAFTRAYIADNEAIRSAALPVVQNQSDMVGYIWDGIGQHAIADDADATYQQMTVSSAFSAPAITTLPANDVPAVLLPHVGATFPLRDAVDNQLIADYSAGTGAMLRCVTPNDTGVPSATCAISNNGGWPSYSTGLPLPVVLADSDDDGMADSWELSRGLSVGVDDSAQDDNSNGYTNIEEYVASLASTETGSISVVMDASPDSAQSFDFTASGGLISPGAFSLTDNNGGAAAEQVFDDLASGVYTFAQSQGVADWQLLQRSCSSANGVMTSTVTEVGNDSIQVNLVAGEHLTCVFTNVQSCSGPNEVLNAAVVVTDQGESDYSNNSSQACIQLQSCSINATISTSCNDNNTPNDSADDVFSYTVNSTGSNQGASFSISGGDTQSGLAYDTDHTFSAFPISGGDLSLTLTDGATPSCTTSVTASAPATCSAGLPELTIVKETYTLGGQLLTTPVSPGDQIVYRLTVTNSGPVDATGVIVRDSLPSEMIYVSDTGGASHSAGLVIWAPGTVAANGSTAVLDITVTVN